MWYFSWILGTGLALSFAVLNAIWYEIAEQQPEELQRQGSEKAAVPPATDARREH